MNYHGILLIIYIFYMQVLCNTEEGECHYWAWYPSPFLIKLLICFCFLLFYNLPDSFWHYKQNYNRWKNTLVRQDEKADHRFQSFKNAGINKLANAPSDVSMQRGKTRFGMNKEHPSDLHSGNLTKTYPQFYWRRKP